MQVQLESLVGRIMICADMEMLLAHILQIRFMRQLGYGDYPPNFWEVNAFDY